MCNKLNVNAATFVPAVLHNHQLDCHQLRQEQDIFGELPKEVRKFTKKLYTTLALYTPSFKLSTH